MESARLLLAGLPPMVARFLTDAAAARAETVPVVTLSSAHDLATEIERAAADIAVVSMEEGEAAALAPRLFRTSRLRVLVRLSASGDRTDIYTEQSPPRRATALDAAELLDQAVSLVAVKGSRSDGRS